ncbi:acyl-CoA carboxylase subunit epsilon [Streptomyces sp. ISL-99]|uniref:acyl-CoA carboxylase epsilon subunit n=1 Tax=Streptomyces TaxID=1883 RepID=UPI001BEBF4C6|nr:acyl-CoA carboxylase epsilon subunit [Streptomyces sp. ISL-99]MBT2526257.1 acyl-CoA carboxylase subunit epsilon [Streptomyces sp. ISL-99]
MSGQGDLEKLLRVERGHAEPEELAALVALLLACAAARRRAGPVPSRSHSPAGWRRPVRIPDFSAPHSWQG